MSPGSGSSAVGWVPILAALVTAFAAVVTVFLNGRANLKLEREKFDSNSRLEREKFDATVKLERQKFDANEKLERQKFESSVILQVIATGDTEKALKNLEFLADAGFLPDHLAQIRTLRDKPEDTPVLPARGGGERWWSAPTRPGVFRWSVRTGSDADAPHVKVTPVKATVEELAELPRPPAWSPRSVCCLLTRIIERKEPRERCTSWKQT